MPGGEDKRQQHLFELGPSVQPEPKVGPLKRAIWTDNKAKLIETYLRLFVYITKHGVYIDAFAGPQDPRKPDSWSAKLVLESEPRRLRKFFLFEERPTSVKLLEELRDGQRPRDRAKGEPKRTIEIFPGDCNHQMAEVLDEGHVRQSEATFALLDQRTFECHWSTVRALATYKAPDRHKIELFYFLADGWLPRSLAAQKNEEVLRAWWGRDDWQQLQGISSTQRAQLFSERFKSDFGYASVKPWPIYEREDGDGRIMYYMIHATDHPDAPSLMDRAYRKAVVTEEEFEQLVLELGLADGE